tara:strand:+ start:697 stop:1005 length:309 start_codon:yes stop_codon:yes gene_type:complete
MWNDNKDNIVMVSEWDDDSVDKDEAGHMIDFIKSVKAIEDVIAPYKEQLKELKANYKDNEWLDAKQQRMAIKIHRMIKDDVDMDEFIDLFNSIKQVVPSGGE